jgi:endonuclease/exonuclease/phosphatase family metal-dependent hydrolase
LLEGRSVKLEIRILSWNLHDLPWFLDPHHSERLRRVTARTVELLPDIITFQEVWLKGDEQPLARALAAVDYDVFESPPGRLGLKESGLLTCVARRSGWTIDTGWRERFVAAAAAIKFWEGDGLSRKGMQILWLRHADHGPLIMINTHLQSQYRNRYTGVRVQQLAQLTQLAEIQATDGIPLIVCGDFNTEPSESRVYRLLSSPPWIDLTEPFRRTCGCYTSYAASDRPTEWIDYIIARGDPTLRTTMELTLEMNRHKDDPYSDHQGLFGILTIERVPIRLSLVPSMIALGHVRCVSTRRRCIENLLYAAVAKGLGL